MMILKLCSVTPWNFVEGLQLKEGGLWLGGWEGLVGQTLGFLPVLRATSLPHLFYSLPFCERSGLKEGSIA